MGNKRTSGKTRRAEETDPEPSAEEEHVRRFSDTELLNYIQRGDHEAFRSLFLEWYQPLCEFAAKHLGSTYLAEEVVQEVFAYIWENHRNWTPRGTLRSWLYKSVKNRSIDHLKHSHVREKHSEEVRISYSNLGAWQQDYMLHLNDFEKKAQQAIQQLPDRNRMVYLLRRQHHLSYSEIADIMEISKKTVEAQMTRALKLLRDKLANHLKA